MAGGQGRFRGLSGRSFAVPPEVALLYLSANPLGDRRQGCIEQVLAEQLDWEAVVDLAYRHGVAGLLRRGLRAAGCWERAPQTSRAALERWQQWQRVLHLGLTHQLARLLDSASLGPFQPVVLKGAALAGAYPDPSLRSMSDIDLLMAESEVQPADAALCRLGYTREGLFYSDEFNRERGYHYRYSDPLGRQLSVELHWDLASRLERRNRLTATMLRRQTVITALGGLLGRPPVEARVPRPAAQVVYLATHAATEGHALSRLIWLSDIAVICATLAPGDWHQVAALARRARARVATFVVLALARHLLGTTVPDGVLADLRPPRLQVLLIERTVNPATLLDPLDERRQATVKYLVVDSPATTARLLVERLFPPPSVLRGVAPERVRRGLPRAYLSHVDAIGRAGLRKAAALLRR